MRQLTMTESRDLEWRDVAEPALESAGQALVRPLAVALCDLDQPIIRGEAPLRSTEPGGRCTSVGIIYEPETPVPLLEMYTQGVHFHIGRAMARADMPAVLELAAAGKLRPERVTSRVAGWDDAIDAIAEPQTKLVISR